MVQVYTRVKLIFLIIALSNITVVAQEKLGLPVIGNIMSETGPAVNARATIFEDGRQIQVLGIANNGRLTLTFSFNHDYILVLSGDSCFPKKISISTVVPKRVTETNPKFPPFMIEQNLFKEIKGIDKSFSDNTILRIFYDPGIDNFISEVYYNDAQVKKQIENAIWRSQQVGKTADELSKLTAEELRLMRQEYNQWIKEAGENYQNAKYQDALMGYKAANKLFPNEQFPLDRIAEINDLLLALQINANLDQVQKEKFSALVKQAESKFNSKEYEDSKGLYRQALNIISTDENIKSRIGEIDKIRATLKVEGEYKSIITEGDRLFAIGSLAPAKAKFKEALVLRPDDEYPKTRIKDIEKEEGRTGKTALQQQRYEAALADGDGFRDKKQYLRARESYNFALSFKPGDQVALDRVAAIDELMKQEDLEKNYSKAISDADKSFNKKEYKGALTNYQLALTIKSGEEYPKSQIKIINGFLESDNQRLLTDQNYQAKIKEADNSFMANNYVPAKGLYTEALKIKPDEKYPVGRIAEIEKILSDLEAKKQTDENYTKLIASADVAFTSKDYTTAKKDYTSALGIKPKESYPVQKIAEINNILAQTSKIQKDYNDAIAQADKLYEKKSMDEARVAYAKSKSIKPEEAYPDDMIGKIDAYFQEQARLAAEKKTADEARVLAQQNTRDKAYNDLVKQGDELKDRKEYVEAIGKYRSALDFKPQEQYPIKQIEVIRGWIQESLETEKAYNDAITLGDKNFGKELYAEARINYNTARSAKPTEFYPSQMISKIDSLEKTKMEAEAKLKADELARLKIEQETRDKNYNESIVKADASFNAKNYNEATTEYQKAQLVKPEESYPPQRIKEIEGLLAQLAKNNQDYTKIIADADKAFRNKAYDEAKTGYTKALALKPDESYPKDLLLKISEILGQVARDQELEKNYQAAIVTGDELFGKRDYLQSITVYQQAATLKPTEAYPQKQIQAAKTKIAESELLAKEKEDLEKSYQNALAVADNAFNSSDFDKAETGYNNALKIKPDEQYPKDRLVQIRQKRDEIIRNRYNGLIAEADASFGKEDYPTARLKYNEAFKLLTGDEYAKKKMEEIDTIIGVLTKAEKDKKELENNYNLAISQADKKFNAASYPEAINFYNQALALKPAESYPSQRISEINKIVNAVKSDEEYKKLVLAADGFFRLKQYTEARSGYVDALKIKSAEEYPKKQIDKIDELIRLQETTRLETEQKSKNVTKGVNVGITTEFPISSTSGNIDTQITDMYNGLINNADAAFAEKEYNIARYYYYKALDVKPGELYPEEKIQEIRKIINARLSDRMERDYQENIDRADDALGKGELAVARAYYNRSLSAKPLEKYPNLQLEQIRKKLDEILGNKSSVEYKALISQGDKAFETTNYSVARYYYLRALELNPSEEYPKQQILKIKETLEKGK